MSGDINLTIEASPSLVELTIRETPPFKVNFFDLAQPDASVLANRVLAQTAATEAAADAETAAQAAEDAAFYNTNAQVSASNAAASAQAAAISEAQAAISETAAATSATNAAASETGATASATAAANSATTASTASSSAQAAYNALVALLDSGVLPIGNQSNDGSWRLVNNAGVLTLQKRVSGTFETLIEWTI